MEFLIEQQRHQHANHPFKRHRNQGEIQRTPQRCLKVRVGQGIKKVIRTDPGRRYAVADQRRIGKTQPQGTTQRPGGEQQHHQQHGCQQHPCLTTLTLGQSEHRHRLTQPCRALGRGIQPGLRRDFTLQDLLQVLLQSVGQP